MKRVLVVLLALLGGLALLVAGAALVFGLTRTLAKGRVPSRTVLEVNLERSFIEDVPDDPVAGVMFSDAFIVRDFVEALERAAGDDRVAGLVATVGGGGFGTAVTQELRDAVLAFRKSGKFTVAFSETFGEVGAGNGGYYLASAFDEVWLQPSGDVNLSGLLYESPFIRRMLGKMGVTARMDHRHEYKNAMNMFTETAYTEAHREAMQAIMDSQFSQMVRDIAAGRGLTEAQVREAFDHGPFLGEAAVAAKLADGTAYRDEVLHRVKERAGRSARMLYLQPYLERAGRPHEKGKTIALVYGVGNVTRGRSGYSPIFGDVSMGSDTVAAALRHAVEDDDVKAILFRVDSPGGSYVASDAIWRETVRAREAGKPVIVSMGNLAGSGGYFVAMDAAKIVAQPGTITASIGVLGGKMLTGGLWDWLGIDWDEVHTSQQSTLWTGTKDYNPAEWASFQAWLDRVYEDFTGKVAKGRKLPIERVREIARGRIWTGEAGRELGLVDELGGFPVALRLAKEAAGIGADEPVRLEQFPRKKSTWEKLWSETPESSESKALVGLLRELQPAARLSRQAAFPRRPAGVLSMPLDDPAM